MRRGLKRWDCLLIALTAMCLYISPPELRAQPTEFELEWSATNAEVRQFLGGRGGKMVYVNFYANRKALHFIDFSEGDGYPVIHRIPAAQNPTAPVPSPDGRWVVFASCPGVYGEFGTPVSVRSSAYICRLAEGAEPVLVAADSAYEPRFLWVSESLTVIFPTLAPEYAWEGIGKTITITIDTTGGTPIPKTRHILFEHGGYTAGLSADRRYLGGGGGKVVLLDLLSGRTRPDTVLNPYSGQGCNASITSSRHRPGMLMYLDFGSGGVAYPEINNGQPWSTWNLIWIATQDGRQIAHYPYPKNPVYTYLYPDSFTTNPSPTMGIESFRSATWHHPEWSNHPHYAAAAVTVDRAYRRTAWFHTYHQERAYIINLRTGEYLEIARRKNLAVVPEVDSAKTNGIYWPTLWVEGNAATFEDEWLGISRPSTGSIQRKSSFAVDLREGVLTSQKPVSGIAVYSVLGHEIHRQKVDPASRTVPLRPVPPGVYFVRVYSMDHLQTVLRWTVRN